MRIEREKIEEEIKQCHIAHECDYNNLWVRVYSEEIDMVKSYNSKIAFVIDSDAKAKALASLFQNAEIKQWCEKYLVIPDLISLLLWFPSEKKSTQSCLAVYIIPSKLRELYNRII